MPLLVSLDVYSGRPNPTWKLNDKQSRELLKRMGTLSRTTAFKPPGVQASLGYRGFRVTGPSSKQVGTLSLYTHGGVVDPGQRSLNFFDSDRDLEHWLLRTGRNELEKPIQKFMQEELTQKAVHGFDVFAPDTKSTCPTCPAADAPPYNPGPWNTPAVQPKNNCYNYANDQITNTFAQPGRATGHPIKTLSCSGVVPSAVSDGLVAVSAPTAKLGKGQGWYVAVVIWPGQDYHWYRQDQSGCWSHKPGQTAVRDVDNAGAKISDPKTCNRGPYTDFCTYMVTTRKVRIR